MLRLKNAFRFIIKKPFQSLVVLLAVFISVGVQFFILSLGSVLDKMLLDQTTSYQDHIIIENITPQNTFYDELDFSLKELLLNADSNIKHVNYFLPLNGNITMIDNNTLTTPIRLMLFGYDNKDNSDNFLNYLGLDYEDHLLEGSTFIDTSKNEIMLDFNFANNNNIEIGQTLTYKMSNSNISYNFKVIGIYDLGVFRKNNNYTYIDLDKFEDLSNNNFSLNIQLHKTSLTNKSLNIIKETLGNQGLTYKTWEDAIPEISVLNDAQKVVILMIEIFISFAFFLVILSVLNYSIKQKYHQFGILRALGQTTKDIRITLLHQILITSLTAITLGLAAGTYAITSYASYMVYPNGKPRFYVNLNVINYVLPLILTLGSAVVASMFAFMKIRKLTIIELIKE